MGKKGASGQRSAWLLATALLVWAVAASVAAALYYDQAAFSQRQAAELQGRLQETISLKQGVEAEYAKLRGNIVSVTVLLNYGNGTVERHAHVALWRKRPTVFLALLSVASVDFKYYKGIGVWVDSINGVSNCDKTGQYWLWYLYHNRTFVLGPTAPDAYVLRDGDILSYNYTKVTF